mgnify:FL=1
MAAVTGFTAARMLQIENAAITGGAIVGDNLILTRHDTTTVNAGNVRGPQGNVGPTGEVTTAALNAAIEIITPNGRIPRVRATMSGLQTIAHNTITVLNWTTEEFDSDTFHSTSSNTSRLTVPTGLGGVYMVTYSLVWNATASQISSAWIQKNGGTPTTRYGFEQQKNDSVNGIGLSGSAALPLNAGDYVELLAFQNSGAGLDCGGAISGFSMVRLGPQ